jgi:lipid-A-disaccharide synthase
MVDALHELPAADSIERQLGLSGERPLLALLPGSRRQEIERLLPIYLEACRSFQEQFRLVIPASNAANKAIIEQIALAAKIPVMVIDGHSRELLKVAHFGIVTSGTATLEAALLGCPMVIAYRMSTLSWALMKHLIRTPYAGLPNILAGQMIVPELIQSDLTVQSLADALATHSREDARQAQQAAFVALEQQLGANFGERCASVITERLEQAL